jgi:hypothetical protein
METQRCPKCESSIVMSCAVLAQGQGGGNVCLVPFRSRTFRLKAGVGFSSGFFACLSCGHVWTTVPPDEILAFIETHGTELVRQHLESLRVGPGHDLPGTPEAIEAAQKVADIDALVLLDGRQPEATRRYRELAACTWDEAIGAVRGWHNLKRAEKLARFGWVVKEGHAKDTPDGHDHPMRDALLDG